MILVRRPMDRSALAEFLFPICLNELALHPPGQPLTLDLLVAALESWDIVEFFDTEKGVIIGAAAREPNNYVHIYVDRARRVSWAPHATLEAALDIFLSDSDRLYAAIPLQNRITISMVRKLGFMQTRTECGTAFLVISRQNRRQRSSILKASQNTTANQAAGPGRTEISQTGIFLQCSEKRLQQHPTTHGLARRLSSL
jgi:hypothetical protein